MNRPLAIGVDLGGTGIKIALVQNDGRILERRRLQTPTDYNPARIVDEICAVSDSWINGALKKRIQGVGIGCAGDIDARRGVVRLSPNLGWRDVPFLKYFQKALPKTPLSMDNDANVAAWAAYCVEGQRRVKNLLCITLGTGVGGGIVLNGQLYRGATGSAGEFGHTTLYPSGTPCACGNRGCLERYVGGRAIVEETLRLLREKAPSSIPSLVQYDLTRVDAKIIEKAALQGDAFAQSVWRRAGENLGIAIASLINSFNPERIYLAGGISRAGRLLFDPMTEMIHRRAFPVPAKAAKVALSKLDQDLGVVGAALSLFP